jgi:hypothetical protein
LEEIALGLFIIGPAIVALLLGLVLGDPIEHKVGRAPASVVANRR